MEFKLPKRYYVEIDFRWEKQLGLLIVYSYRTISLSLPFCDIDISIDRRCDKTCMECYPTEEYKQECERKITEYVESNYAFGDNIHPFTIADELELNMAVVYDICDKIYKKDKTNNPFK